MVMVNRLKVELFSPGLASEKEQIQMEPFIYEVENLEGESVNTTVGDGNITFISYWATWCPPCIAELSSIDALYRDYGDKIDFLMISDEHPEKIKLFLEKRNFLVPAMVSKMHPPKDLFEKTIPTNHIIDHTGKIVVKEKGASNWNSEKVRSLLDALIAQSEASAK